MVLCDLLMLNLVVTRLKQRVRVRVHAGKQWEASTGTPAP